MTATNGSKLWPIVAGVATALLLGLGAMWGMIEAHAGSPHQGAVSRDEMVLIREMFESHQNVMESHIDRLEDTISELRSELRAERESRDR
ncbi:MAG: hypothetical protein ACPGVG_16125 [Mycobacterium sp.]